MAKIYINIAGLKMRFSHNHDPNSVILEDAYQSFLDTPFEDPDITFELDTTASFPSIESCRQVFTSQPDGLWSLYEDQGETRYCMTLQNIERGSKPFTMVIADRKFQNFTIHDRPDHVSHIVLLRYPIAELVVTGHININHLGILLHSAGISLYGKGLLFSGTSGSGKSTIAEIWQEDREATILTDERVVIRYVEDDLWAFGTPWHGTAEVHKNVGVPIEKIYFIKHGTMNKARLISQKDALNRLLVRCFPTFWNRNGMEFVLGFCERIVRDKKCYELEFVADSSITDFIKHAAF